MAINKGWDGALKIGTSVASSETVHINNWEISFAGDALENTSFGDTVYDRGFQPGLRSHTITFSGYSDPADNSHSYLLDRQKSTVAAAAVWVDLHYDRDTPKGWEGSGVVTGLTISEPVDGLCAFSGTVQITAGLSTV